MNPAVDQKVIPRKNKQTSKQKMSVLTKNKSILLSSVSGVLCYFGLKCIFKMFPLILPKRFNPKLHEVRELIFIRKIPKLQTENPELFMKGTQRDILLNV